MKFNQVNLEVARANPGRPRKQGSSSSNLRRVKSDDDADKFQMAVALREHKRQMPEPVVNPDQGAKQFKLRSAIAQRNAPVVKTERDVLTGIIIQTLENGIVQVFVPQGVDQRSYHVLIGRELFPEKYKEETVMDKETGELITNLVRE